MYVPGGTSLPFTRFADECPPEAIAAHAGAPTLNDGDFRCGVHLDTLGPSAPEQRVMISRRAMLVSGMIVLTFPAFGQMAPRPGDIASYQGLHRPLTQVTSRR